MSLIDNLKALRGKNFQSRDSGKLKDSEIKRLLIKIFDANINMAENIRALFSEYKVLAKRIKKLEEKEI